MLLKSGKRLCTAATAFVVVTSVVVGMRKAEGDTRRVDY